MTLSATATPIHIASIHDAIDFLSKAPFFNSTENAIFVVILVSYFVGLVKRNQIFILFCTILSSMVVALAVIDKHTTNVLTQALSKNISSDNTFSVNVVDPQASGIRLVNGDEDTNKKWNNKNTAYVIKSLECSVTKYNNHECFVFFSEKEKDNGRIYEMNLIGLAGILVEKPETLPPVKQGVLEHSDGVRFEKSEAVEK